jgi:hypothetical protein
VTVRLLAVAVALVAARGSLARAEIAAPPPTDVAPPERGVVVLRLDASPGIDAGLIDRVQQEVEGRADGAGLAVTLGAANRADTAALAGCTTAQAAGCDGMILDALGTDELVYGTVDRSLSGHRVTLARARRGAPATEVTIDVPAGDLEGAAAAIAPGLDRLFPDPITANPDHHLPALPLPGSATITRDDGGGGGIDTRKAILIGGASAGAALIVIGALQWSEAANLQGEIDDADDDSPEDIAALLELEDRADGYATRGNWLVFGGLAVAGGTVAWYLLTRDRGHDRDVPSTAVRPWAVPGGGGVTLSWSTP